MSLLAAYLLAIIFLFLLPLLLTMWTSIKRHRYINQYNSYRNSELSVIILNLKKIIDDHGREIKNKKQGKG